MADVRDENGILDLTWYPGEDYYCDGEIEDRILGLVKSGADRETVLRENHEWPILYHLSDIRENILNWYPFDPEATLLEIGAGCGAVTGLFCRSVRKVTAIDLSKKRSEINALRNGGRGNLTVFVGNFEDIRIEEKFDYVTLIGVLEYSPGYISGGDRPYLEMLRRAREFLKPGGKLLLAIENKFGLKYFAGAPEDHTGKAFEGIEGYRAQRGVYTFSRPELESLLREAGFTDNRFYYPMPDYKLPSVIYSDSYPPEPGAFARETESYDRPRYAFFDENAVYNRLIRDGQFPYFANSFLVAAGCGENALGGGEMAQIVYAKYNKLRRKEFRIRTCILEENGARTVEKRALCPEAEAHILRMAERAAQLAPVYPGLEFIRPREESTGAALRFDYLTGETADSLLAERAGSKEALRKGFEELFERILPGKENREPFRFTPEFREVFGEAEGLEGAEAAAPVNIDCLPENLLVKDGQLVCLDYEWVFDFTVPLDYIRYRVVNYFYRNHPEASRLVSGSDLLSGFGLTPLDCAVYAAMELEFQRYVFGGEADCRYTENYRQPVLAFDRVLADKEQTERENGELRKVVDHYGEIEKKLRKVGLWQGLQAVQKAGRRVKGLFRKD